MPHKSVTVTQSDVRAIIDRFPPLTEAQRVLLTRLFRGSSSEKF